MSNPPGSSVFWGRPGGVTHIWLWLGGLQRNKRRVGGGGAVGWAMQDQSGRFVYDATTNGVQWPPSGPGNILALMSSPFAIHLYVSMGVQFGYCFPLRSNMWAAWVSVAENVVHYGLKQLHSDPWWAVKPSEQTLRTLHVASMSLTHLSLSNLITWQRLLALVSVGP